MCFFIPGTSSCQLWCATVDPHVQTERAEPELPVAWHLHNGPLFSAQGRLSPRRQSLSRHWGAEQAPAFFLQKALKPGLCPHLAECLLKNKILNEYRDHSKLVFMMFCVPTSVDWNRYDFLQILGHQSRAQRSARSRQVYFLYLILAEVIVEKSSSRSKPHNASEEEMGLLPSFTA